MGNRRAFLKSIAIAAAGAGVAGRFTYDVLAQAAAGGRRQISIGGRRIKVIDAHAHLSIPAVANVVKGTPFERNGNAARNQIIGPDRLKAMDELGIDMAVLTQQGAFWYGVPDRELARTIVRTMNEGTAAVVKQYPDRFVGMAAFPMQFPDLAAEALEDGVKRLGLKGGGISAGFLADKEFSAPEYDVFWAKAQELGVLLFMHPGGDTGAEAHLRGKGNLGNTVGNPLETTIFLSHLIYEGTLDKFPGVKICCAHAGGFLPSYMGRTDGACVRQPDACGAKKRPVDEYFKTQIMADSMVFRDDGLRHMIAEMGAGQIVYGTDMPFPWPANPDTILDNTLITDAQKEAILGGNLITLLKLGGGA